MRLLAAYTRGGNVKRFGVVPVIAVLMAHALAGPAAAKGSENAPFWNAKMNAATFAKLQDDPHLMVQRIAGD